MMRKLQAGFFLMSILFAGQASTVHAQQSSMVPPKILVVDREVIKPGKEAAHQGTEGQIPKAFAKAKWGTHYIAANALSGEHRVVFLIGYDSFAAWEADNMATAKNKSLSADLDSLNSKDGDLLSGVSTLVMTLDPELSYNIDAPIPGMRYLDVTSVHLKPGHTDQFKELRKMVTEAHKTAGVKEHYAVYHLAAGGLAGTYFILTPMHSLAEEDQSDDAHGKAYKDAVGDENRKKIVEFGREGIDSAEGNIFAFDPGMSYPSQEWIDNDSEFWNPHPPAASAPKAKAKPTVKKN
jgi:hypothetical protein